MDLAADIYTVTRIFPRVEMFGLTARMRGGDEGKNDHSPFPSHYSPRHATAVWSVT